MGETSQDSERKAADEGHSHTVERRGRDMSGQQKNPANEAHELSSTEEGDKSGQRKKDSEQRPLTYCDAQGEG
jgi:hypothetical protein